MEAIWNANPTVNMLYCFEDGNCFIKHSEAASYAQSTNMAYIVKVRENLVEKSKIKQQISDALINEVNNFKLETEEETKPTKTNKK